jgi:hypothetical protein
LKDYVPQLITQVSELKKAIAAYASQPVPIIDLMEWYTFDSMGRIAFSEEFSQLQTRTWHPVAAQQYAALEILGPLNPVPWLMILATSLLPSVWRLNDWNNMVAFCSGTIQKRLVVWKQPGPSPCLDTYLSVRQRGLC